jgi:hypothetical protein
LTNAKFQLRVIEHSPSVVVFDDDGFGVDELVGRASMRPVDSGAGFVWSNNEFAVFFAMRCTAMRFWSTAQRRAANANFAPA